MIGADNQQATRHHAGESSETIRQTPFLKEEILAYLNGALHDASRNKKTRIRFVQKHPEWLVLIQNLLEEIRYRSWIYKEGRNRELYALETTCPELDFSYDPFNGSRTQKIMYLRGFFDAEGGIPRNGGVFYIQLVQKNYPKILAIKSILAELGIKTGRIHNPSRNVDPNYWRIFVLKESHKLFARQIGSWHPVKREIFQERMKI